MTPVARMREREKSRQPLWMWLTCLKPLAFVPLFHPLTLMNQIPVVIPAAPMPRPQKWKRYVDKGAFEQEHLGVVLAAVITTINILRFNNLPAAIFGSLACKLYGNPCCPQDADILVFPSSDRDDVEPEMLKRLLVAAAPGFFYLKNARDRLLPTRYSGSTSRFAAAGPKSTFWSRVACLFPLSHSPESAGPTNFHSPHFPSSSSTSSSGGRTAATLLRYTSVGVILRMPLMCSACLTYPTKCAYSRPCLRGGKM